jgi:predicted GTPase
MMRERRIIIVGAAGRDFHNFNCLYRDDPHVRVVAFTATQIPGIDERIYPAELAGPRYPNGIPIAREEALTPLIVQLKATEVVFAYSDVSHAHVMHLASQVNAAGASFVLPGVDQTMLQATVPVVAVCAVRTGCGKSQTSRYVARYLAQAGLRVVVMRHPMPYGELKRQIVQRFAHYDDLAQHECTIEEREEYEAHLDRGIVVYAGVDYQQILQQAQDEADVLIWDGGNNDTPFVKPDLWLTVVDPLRPGHELKYFPGETNLRAADVIVANKVNEATSEDLETVFRNAERVNPEALLIRADSALIVEQAASLDGKRVLALEDGPTLTHGSMPFGAAEVAAKRYGAELVDPRPYAVGSIAELYRAYPHLGNALPAMGYSAEQVDDLRQTIESTPCDLVLAATPIDIQRVVRLTRPTLRVRYELEDLDSPTLAEQLQRFIAERFG